MYLSFRKIVADVCPINANDTNIKYYKYNIFTDVFISALDRGRHISACTCVVDSLVGFAVLGVGIEDSVPFHLDRPLVDMLGPIQLEARRIGSRGVFRRLQVDINRKVEVHRLEHVVRQGAMDSCSSVPQF